MITDTETFFADGCGRCERFATDQCSTRLWLDGLMALRRICLAAGLAETAKWGHPVYMHAGRNIALLAGFRDDFRITFMDAALLKDPEGVLVSRGPNTRHADMIRFVHVEDVARLEPVIAAYLTEAKGYAEAGIRPAKEVAEFDLPDEFVDALDADPELAEAFDRLTPGRQRSYALVLGDAKAPTTRIARIEKLRPKILAGKGANER